MYTRYVSAAFPGFRSFLSRALLLLVRRYGYNRAHGAYLYARMAIFAGELLRIIVTRNFDNMFEASSRQLQYRLRIFPTTNKQAFPAKDTVGRHRIKAGMFDHSKVQTLQFFIFSDLKSDSQEFCNLLQFAMPFGQAVLAVHVMGCHDQLKVYPLELSDRRRIRLDHHPIPSLHQTGGTGLEFAFDFNKA